ncbi:hypothetical protein BDM02DRAFT_3186192 [Thelephora ganbajun]|uniref:Uncharacterized protein n=1 Tax=Thelephora ganbajun TaxID=370292 RepID=A0ACB6ZJ43_THEGA|nr:hypothetical protein BDM02DRAFT_3186192 [Thelephora ganbajun]
MAGRALRPHNLLDLSVSRVSQRLWRKQSARGVHSQAVDFAFASQLDAVDVLANSPGRGRNPDNASLYSLKRRNTKSSHAVGASPEEDRQAMSLLEQKVEDLKLMVSDKDEADLAYGYEPVYTEMELLDIYQDLLSTQIQAPESTESAADTFEEQADDRALVHSLISRVNEHAPSEPGTSQLHATCVDSQGPVSRYRQTISRLTAILQGPGITAGHPDPSPSVPSGRNAMQQVLPSPPERAAFIRECIRVNERESAVASLTLMERAGLELDDNVVTPVVSLYARAGDVARTESILSRFVKGSPNPSQRHQHIRAYINSTPPDTIPLSALSLLHKYENMNLAPPMKTYASLISTLTSVPSSLAKAQAWDLFSHMRYVAYPTPDAVIYNLMILACARAPPSGGAGDSEPQRALDLFTEMTVDNNIPPTRDTYTAIILACARSGEAKFVNEAFRLAKEMLDGHRDALGRPAFTPNNALFGALLQGAKRIRDLPRTRWILAEMVQIVVRQHHARVDDGLMIPEQDEVVLTENKMVHVFHAYASYQVPFHRSATRIAERRGVAVETVPPEPTVTDPHKTSNGTAETEAIKENVGEVATSDTDPRFNSLPPQSREEVLAEVKNLFEGILHDTQRSQALLLHNSGNESPMLFKDVRVSTELVNAYLSVHYSHGRVGGTQNLFKTLFEEVGVKRSLLSYVEALEACARWSCIKARRDQVMKFTEEVWELLQQDVGVHDEMFSIRVRLIERANLALIRVLSSLNLLDKAMERVKLFAQTFPPKALLALPTPTKPPLRSTHTILSNSDQSTKTPAIPRPSGSSILSNIGGCPLVRLTSDTELVDDSVPPFLTVKDVEFLHHRLIAENRLADVKYLTWLLKSYSGSLRRRRERTLQQGVSHSLLD